VAIWGGQVSIMQYVFCKKMGTSGGVDPPLFAAFFLDDMIYIAAMSIE